MPTVQHFEEPVYTIPTVLCITLVSWLAEKLFKCILLLAWIPLPCINILDTNMAASGATCKKISTPFYFCSHGSADGNSLIFTSFWQTKPPIFPFSCMPILCFFHLSEWMACTMAGSSLQGSIPPLFASLWHTITSHLCSLYGPLNPEIWSRPCLQQEFSKT